MKVTNTNIGLDSVPAIIFLLWIQTCRKCPEMSPEDLQLVRDFVDKIMDLCPFDHKGEIELKKEIVKELNNFSAHPRMHFQQVVEIWTSTEEVVFGKKPEDDEFLEFLQRIVGKA